VNRFSLGLVLATASAAVLALTGCSGSGLGPETAPVVETPPPGLSATAESYIGGAWASTPVRDATACQLGVDDFCWTVEVGDTDGCEKGFAFAWQVEDAYGDVAATGRERVLSMEANEFQDVGFRIVTTEGSSTTSTVTITSAACI
jgi:hypothetical protein